MADTAFILIVEDEAAHGEAIAEGLRRMGHACHVVTTAKEAVESIEKHPPHVVVTDYRLGEDLNGMDVLRIAKDLSAETEVILITAHGSESLAREALRGHGIYRAYDYITKPLDLEEVREVVGRAARQAMAERENKSLREQLDKSFNFEGLIGSSDPMNRLIRRLKLLANSKITLLIMGASGTGKDLIAQAVHVNSPRKLKPYRVINCAGLSEGVLESELFGHKKGAFTGAVTERKGLFEASDGGTLFLDEVAEMPPSMQAKVLRVLENGEIKPVGSNDSRKTDVRVIAGTHRNLREMVEEGTFREDLFYRLHQAVVHVPALRDRREDIPLLIDHFIQLGNEEHGKHVKGVSSEVRRKLVNHRWQGNVRELKSTIESMLVLAQDDMLDVDDLPDEIRGSTDLVPVNRPSFPTGITMQEGEKLLIQQTLQQTEGNREKAAKVLNIGARTLYRKLKEYGLS
jgi:two-component system response regulator HydG